MSAITTCVYLYVQGSGQGKRVCVSVCDQSGHFSIYYAAPSLYLVFLWMGIFIGLYIMCMYAMWYPDRIPQDKIPQDRIPTDKITQDIFPQCQNGTKSHTLLFVLNMSKY